MEKNNTLLLDNINIFECINWKKVSERRDLSYTFMIHHKDYLDWDVLTRIYCNNKSEENEPLNGGIEFIKFFSEFIRWDILSVIHKFDNIELSFFKNKIYWNNYINHNPNDENLYNFIKENTDILYSDKTITKSFISNFTLDENFIYDHYGLLRENIDILLDTQTLNINLIHKIDANYFLTDIEIEKYCKYQSIDKSFILSHFNSVDWSYISKYQNLSEDFILSHRNNLDWDYLTKFQNLSEEFLYRIIEEIKPKKFAFWDNISKYQNISESFIIKYKKYIYWRNLHYNEKIKLSYTFKEKYDKKLTYEYF